jgi:tetratricopeptide (TPR) repeat protein
MNGVRPLGILLVAALSLSCASSAPEPSLDRAQSFLRAEQWQAASDELLRLVAVDPDNGAAWFHLGFALQKQGLYDAAIEAAGHAVKYPELRSTALYNIACAHAQMSRPQPSVAALERALDAGFADLEAATTDPDLDPIRAEPGFPALPRLEVLESLPDSGSLPCSVLSPPNLSASSEVPVMLTPTPRIGGLEVAASRRGWLVVAVGSPGGGPLLPRHVHHLTGLLDAVEDRWGVEDGGFHMVGRGRGGVTAFHAVLHSPGRFRSLTVAPGYPGEGRDADLLHLLRNVQVGLFVGGRDTYWLEQTRWTYALLEDLNVEVHLEVLPEDDHALTGLMGGVLANYLDSLR